MFQPRTGSAARLIPIALELPLPADYTRYALGPRYSTVDGIILSIVVLMGAAW